MTDHRDNIGTALARGVRDIVREYVDAHPGSTGQDVLDHFNAELGKALDQQRLAERLYG